MLSSATLLAWLLLAGCIYCSHSTAVAQGLAEKKNKDSQCARPGYVFIDCQEPDISSSDEAKRILYTFSGSADISRIQQKCDDWKKPPGICAAFTTSGVLYTVDESTGKMGAFTTMSDCDYSYSDYNMPCMGTYVFDGSMTYQQPVQSNAVQQGITDSDRAAAVAGGAVVSVPDGQGVTSVVAQLKAAYVRQGSAGGDGKVGKGECSLC